MSTPAYAPPSVGPAGLTVSSYQSILADNLTAFLNIFGQNQYVGPDSAIYQLISIFSLKHSDANAGLSLVYNQSSPKTAVGAGLDRLAPILGIVRANFSYSTAILNLSGTPNTVINNGFAQDQNGFLWALPSPTQLNAEGTASVIATCTTPGNISAQPNTINIVATPVNGWTPPTGTVTNPALATAGNPVEPDSQFRARMALSVALPSTTPLAATIAALLAVPGVTRIAPGYPTPGGAPGTSIENPTGEVDSWGNPAHSISLVIENGDSQVIANTIYAKKTVGCFTNGTTEETVTDPTLGFTERISFFRPTYQDVFVYVAVHGYGITPTSSTLGAIQSAIVNYLNALSIGETVSMAAIIYEAMAINTTLTAPGFGVQTVMLGILVASTTATVTNGSNVITVASASGLAVGQMVVGGGIPGGSLITGITGTSVTLSQQATASGIAVPIQAASMTAADIAMTNFYYVALGEAINVGVVAV